MVTMPNPITAIVTGSNLRSHNMANSREPVPDSRPAKVDCSAEKWRLCECPAALRLIFLRLGIEAGNRFVDRQRVAVGRAQLSAGPYKYRPSSAKNGYGPAKSPIGSKCVAILPNLSPGK
jgi:hypothetical protein